MTAGKAVASARRSSSGRPDRTKIIVGVVVVLLLAAVVIGGVLYTNAQKDKTEGQTIQPRGAESSSVSQPPDYPVRRDGAVVVVGKDNAKVTLDVYEDFLCPFCGEFEKANGPAITAKVKDGSVRVRYHILAILNNKSDPEGYSLDSANAALCVADTGRFPAYHESLFNSQPEEGARGYDKGQLTRLGNDLGVTAPDFKACVDSGRYNREIQAAEDQATQLPYLQREYPDGRKGFGTPTIAVGEKIVDTSDAQWLDKLVSAG